MINGMIECDKEQTWNESIHTDGIWYIQYLSILPCAFTMMNVVVALFGSKFLMTRLSIPLDFLALHECCRTKLKLIC